jgi:hypothetical protein
VDLIMSLTLFDQAVVARPHGVRLGMIIVSESSAKVT